LSLELRGPFNVRLLLLIQKNEQSMNDEQELEHQRHSIKEFRFRNRVGLTSSVMEFHFSPPSFAAFNQQVDRLIHSFIHSIRFAEQQLKEEIGWDEGKKNGMQGIEKSTYGGDTLVVRMGGLELLPEVVPEINRHGIVIHRYS